MPFRKDKRFLVDQLFIERGIFLLIKEGIKLSWQKLESYHSMFDESKITSTRIVLSSKAGYGKSTLALKFASDWTNECKQSPLGDVEIFILLRLKQFDGSVSIFKAIQKSLLSYNSGLGEGEVKKILCDSKSVVMVLEGFDKYVCKGKPGDDDVINILKGRMLPDFRVILTTTLSCKPDFMDPTTAEVTLGGFDPDAQDKYISKALVTDDKGQFAKVRDHINDNSVLRELCKVPFIFALVLNLIQEEEEHEKLPLWCNSVTGFFRYVIGSIYKRKKEKMRETDRIKYEKFKDNHNKLDKVSFEALTEGENVKQWRKDYLEKQIGQALYDYYIAFEILIEEEVLVVDSSPNASTLSLVERKTHTKFYHELFMQWFAAHYIAQNETKLLRGYSDRHLNNLLDKKLDSIFMFACGINKSVTRYIVYFLKKQHDREGCDQLIKACRREKAFCQ